MGSPTVTPLQENLHDFGFMVSTPNGHLHIDTVTLSGGAKVLAGTVLGQITASKKFVPLNLAANDGSQTAAGILGATKDVTAADKQAATVVRNCEVNAAELIWPSGATGAQITAGAGQLKTLGIIAR